ncbi:MAG: phosphoenolpyruvate--protein phosphotransferase [Lachnospiraceae bacterium]|nr:phosphoenolpyruvate--protein phosphotransferase [Lachnospiraceae bacterium]
METLKGKAASGGIAVAPLWHIGNDITVVASNDTPEGLKKQYFSLKSRVRAEFRRLSSLSDKEDSSMTGLFESYSIIMDDPVFEEAVLNRINRGYSIHQAILESGTELSRIFEKLSDEYMQARAADLLSVAEELLRELSGRGKIDKPDGEKGPDDDGFIIVAANLSPARLMRIDKKLIKGIVLSGGTVNDHTSILAGNMGIPCVVAAGDRIFDQKEGRIIIDGNEGEVYLEPDEETIGKFIEKKLRIEKLRSDARQRIKQDQIKSEKSPIAVMGNISDPGDTDSVLLNEADGIGLFRTEFIYLKGDDYPTEDEQFDNYSKVLKMMGDKKVIIRTCDIGYDKAARYMNLPFEQNPGMGIRGIRISLEHPEMFLTQLRALYRASVYGNLMIMFPMISSLWEIKEAKKYCEKARKSLENEGISCKKVPLGIMIETPSAAILSGEFAKECDFFSIGSNDLTQYTTGADRINEDIEKYYDPVHPAVLELIKITAENAHKNNIPVGICGELAADTSLSEFFIKAGIDELSVAPGKIIPVRLSLIS